MSPLWLLPGRAGQLLATIALGVIVVGAIVDALALPSARDVVVERTLPASVGIGDRGEGEYLIRSNWGARLRATLSDDLPPALTGGAFDEELELPAHASTRVAISVSGQARGRFALGPVALRIRTRWGLVARRFRWSLDDAILVTPSIASVRRFRLLALQHRLPEAGIRSVRQRGEGR